VSDPWPWDSHPIAPRLSCARTELPSLLSPVPPMAVVFARTAGQVQLLLVCRVTSFYPRPIAVTWLRDGREVPPSPALSTGTVLPNADLTYQLRSTLLVSPQDGHGYACRVQHCSLGDRSLLVPWGRSSPSGMQLLGTVPSARGAGELTGCVPQRTPSGG